MNDSFDNPLKFEFLWKHRGNQNYEFRDVIHNGNFTQHVVFKDRQRKQKVLGKVVTSPGEGEGYHWLRLQHENLAPLLDIISINETKSVYIFPFIGSSLQNVIHDREFLNDPDCFCRKKAYTEDILWALDYLHHKSLCIMNLSELIIYICDISDKAILSDFSGAFLIQRVTNEKIQLPDLYKPPEVNTEDFQPISAETWTCGVMLLQVFTKHLLPSAFLGDEVHQVLHAVAEINYDIIKEANPGSDLQILEVENLRSFLDLFLTKNPKDRIDAQSAAISPFLKYSKRKTVQEVINFDRGPPKSSSSIYSLQAVLENMKNNNNFTAFKDIYIDEAAKYKIELEQLSSRHTTINSDCVKNGKDLIETNETRYYTNKKSSSEEINSVIDDALFDETLISGSSREIIIRDTEESVSKQNSVAINNASMGLTNELNTSCFKKIQNNVEVTVETLQNILTHKYLSYGGKLANDFSCNHEQSVMKDSLNDFQSEQSDSNSNLSSETNISTDSLESSVKTEKSNLNKFKGSDLNSPNDHVLRKNNSNQMNETYLFSQAQIGDKIKTQTQINSKSEPNLNIKAGNNINLISSISDSNISYPPEIKYKDIALDSLDLIASTAHPNPHNSREIVLDGTILIRDHEIYNDEENHKAQSLQDRSSLASEIRVSNSSINYSQSQTISEGLNQGNERKSNENGCIKKNSWTYLTKEEKLRYEADKNINADYVTVVGNTEYNSKTSSKVTKFYQQDEQRVNLPCDKDYYNKQVVLNELSVLTEPEIDKSSKNKVSKEECKNESISKELFNETKLDSIDKNQITNSNIIPTMNTCEMSIDNELVNSKTSAKREVQLWYEADKYIKVDNSTVAENTECVKVSSNASKFYQQEMPIINHNYFKNHSKQTVSNSLSNSTEPENDNFSKNLVLIPEVRSESMSNSLFNKSKFSLRYKHKRTNCNCFSKMNMHYLPSDDRLMDFETSSTMTVFPHSSLLQDISSLDTISEIVEKSKKPKRTKKSWIRYLCPGSKKEV